MLVCIRASRTKDKRHRKVEKTDVKKQEVKRCLHTCQEPNCLTQRPEKFRKMHKTMVFGLILFCTTILAIKEGAMGQVCPKNSNAPVNSNDDN